MAIIKNDDGEYYDTVAQARRIMFSDIAAAGAFSYRTGPGDYIDQEALATRVVLVDENGDPAVVGGGGGGGFTPIQAVAAATTVAGSAPSLKPVYEAIFASDIVGAAPTFVSINGDGDLVFEQAGFYHITLDVTGTATAPEGVFQLGQAGGFPIIVAFPTGNTGTVPKLSASFILDVRAAAVVLQTLYNGVSVAADQISGVTAFLTKLS